MPGTLSLEFPRVSQTKQASVAARIVAPTVVVAVSRASVNAKFALATAASLIRQAARHFAAKLKLPQPRPMPSTHARRVAAKSSFSGERSTGPEARTLVPQGEKYQFATKYGKRITLDRLINLKDLLLSPSMKFVDDHIGWWCREHGVPEKYADSAIQKSVLK